MYHYFKTTSAVRIEHSAPWLAVTISARSESALALFALGAAPPRPSHAIAAIWSRAPENVLSGVCSRCVVSAGSGAARNGVNMAPPLQKMNKVVKRRKKFVRHQSDRKIAVKPNWRKQKGIDSRVRRKFKGCGVVQPNIGYGTNKKHRHILPNGMLKAVVHNMADLELLMMHNRRYCAEVAHNVSARKRKEIVERAMQLDVKVLNKDARVKSADDE